LVAGNRVRDTTVAQYKAIFEMTEGVSIEEATCIEDYGIYFSFNGLL
jgi:hypothetical protein